METKQAERTLRKWWGSQALIRWRPNGWVEVGYRARGGVYRRMGRAKTLDQAMDIAARAIQEPLPAQLLEPQRVNGEAFQVCSHALGQWVSRGLSGALSPGMAHEHILALVREGAWMRPREALPAHKEELRGLRLECLRGNLRAVVVEGPYGLGGLAFPVRPDPRKGLVVLTAYETNPGWWEPDPFPPK